MLNKTIPSHDHWLNACNKRIKVYLLSSLSSVACGCARGVADMFPTATSGSLAAYSTNCADPLMA